MIPDNIAPITPLPPAPPGARTDAPSESTRRRWARVHQVALDAASSAGHADGVRIGYAQGWRWGLGCGIACGAVLAGAGWGLWLRIGAAL